MARSMRERWMGNYEAREDFDFVLYVVFGRVSPLSLR